MTLHFGDVVIVSKTLFRQNRTHRDGIRLIPEYFAEWAPRTAKKPFTGILIGFRTLVNGKIEYMEDEGPRFIPRKHFRAALVAFDPYRNPVLVPLDGLTNEIKMEDK